MLKDSTNPQATTRVNTERRETRTDAESKQPSKVFHIEEIDAVLSESMMTMRC